MNSKIFAVEYSGEITSLVYSDNQYINYGPCLVSDSLFINFIAKNTGEKPLLIDRSIPSFFLGLSPNDNQPELDRFRRFARDPNSLPIVFQPGHLDTVKIIFAAADTLITKSGWHESLLGISFIPLEGDAEPIAKIDTFFLMVKKTPYFVSGFEDDISFDSVYINPNIDISKFWRVKNVWTRNQPIIEFDKKLITQPVTSPEITINNLPQGLEIYPDSIIYIPINYHPLNRGLDSMYLRLLYHPLKSQYPDSIDFAWTRIRGVGVEQDLSIDSSNFNWFKDTIDLGSILIGKATELNIYLKNSGNIPFGLKSQNIINSNDNEPNKFFGIIKEFLQDKKHLRPDSSDIIKIEFNPTETGFFTSRLKIESDIFERKISGVQPDKRFKYIYIRGNVVSPKMILQLNSIDFGNVILSNEDCPSERDTVIHIHNAGNVDLFIYNITTNPPYPDSKFFSARQFMLIPANSSDTLRIKFRAVGGDFNSYSSDLILKTNQYAPFDSVVIKLNANSVPPITADLSIPKDLKSKPGSIIEVPIILKGTQSSPAEFAKSFSTSLFYNRSILEFIGTRTIGTATEGSINHGDSFENPNNEELYLDLRSPASTYFSGKDTLIFLKFKTYLGNSVATEISLIEPRFGDNNCDNILSIVKSNGIYSTDSVCGLDYKALPSMSGKFNLEIAESIGGSENIIKFDVPYSTFTSIKLYDLFGTEVHTFFSQYIPSGNYTVYDNYKYISTGMYYIELITPAFRIVKPYKVIH
jgi:hypothetical protein